MSNLNKILKMNDNNSEARYNKWAALHGYLDSNHISVQEFSVFPDRAAEQRDLLAQMITAAQGGGVGMGPQQQQQYQDVNMEEQQDQPVPTSTDIATRNLSSTRQAAALSNAFRNAAMQRETATSFAAQGETSRFGIDTVRSMLLGMLTGLSAGTKPTGTQLGQAETAQQSVWFFTRNQLETDFCALTKRIIEYIKGYYQQHWNLVRGGNWAQLGELSSQISNSMINAAGLPHGKQAGLSQIETISVSLCDLTTIIYRTTADLDAGVQRQRIGDSRTSKFIYWITTDDSLLQAFGPLLRNLVDTPLIHAWPAVSTAFENFIDWFNVTRHVLLPQVTPNSDEARILSQDLSIDTPLFADDGFPNWPTFLHDNLLYVLWLQSMNRFRSTILELAQTAHSRTREENITAFRHRMNIERHSVESILRLLNQRQREIIGGTEILESYVDDLTAAVGDQQVQVFKGGPTKTLQVFKTEGEASEGSGTPKDKKFFEPVKKSEEEPGYGGLKAMSQGPKVSQSQAVLRAEAERQAIIRSRQIARTAVEAQPRIAEANRVWEEVMTQLANPRGKEGGVSVANATSLLNFLNTNLNQLTRADHAIAWPAGIDSNMTLRHYLRGRFQDAAATNELMLSRARQRRGYPTGHSEYSQVYNWILERLSMFDQKPNQQGGRKTRKYRRRRRKTKRRRKRGKKTRHNKRKKKKRSKHTKKR